MYLQSFLDQKRQTVVKRLVIVDNQSRFTVDHLYAPIHLVFAFFKEAAAPVRKMAKGLPSLFDFCLLFELRCARCGPIISPFGHFFKIQKLSRRFA